MHWFGECGCAFTGAVRHCAGIARRG